MKLKQIIESSESLQKLYTIDEISVVTAYKVKQIIDIINPHVGSFYELVSKLQRQYNGDGEVKKKLSPEEIKAFQKEIDELGETDVRVKFKKVEFVLSDSITGLSAGDFENLAPFLDIKIPDDTGEEIEI